MSKMVIPLGDRILVKRRRVGDRIGKDNTILVPDRVKEQSTDLADVLYTPPLTNIDEEILKNADEISRNLTEKARQGDPNAVRALFNLNTFIKEKSIKKGDLVLVGKYIGIDFSLKNLSVEYTVVNTRDIIAVIKDVETGGSNA